MKNRIGEEKIDNGDIIVLKVSPIYSILVQLRLLILIVGLIVVSQLIPMINSFVWIGILGVFIKGVWGVVSLRSIVYVLHKDKLMIQSGVFSIKKGYLELYRVKDYSYSQPFFMRIIGVMNIVLLTSDRSHPTVSINGVPESNILEHIRDLVETQRVLKGVREFD